MAVLKDFPHLNQLADIHEANASFDCVPTSIAACLQWLLGKSYDGGAIKDAVYGAGYQGGTAASAYVNYCKDQGVNLYPVDGTPVQLVQAIRSFIGKSIPLIGTEPDPYANPSLGWSHVLAFFGCDEPAGTLTCLDPYGGHVVTLPDAEWKKRLLFNQVWALEKIAEVKLVGGIPAGWHDNGTELLAPNGIKVLHGFREYVLSHNWHPANVPLEAEHGVPQLEVSNPALGAGTQQAFNWTVLEWTRKQGVFEMWTGKELLFSRSQVTKYYELAQRLRGVAVELQAEVEQMQKQLQSTVTP